MSPSQLTRSRRRWLSLCGPALVALGLLLPGCGRSAEDIRAYQNAGDYNALATVVGNTDVSLALRTQAAIALTELAPVRGRAIGSEALLASLRRLDEGARNEVLSPFVELASERLRQVPAGSDEAAYALKDTAQMLLVNDHQLDKPLLSDESQRTRLRQALTDWIGANFSKRRASRQQRYGVKSLFALLGPEAAETLLDTQTDNIGDAARVIDIVSSFKDQKLRDKAGTWLVKLGREVAKAGWRIKKKPALMEANRSAGYEPTAEQLEQQLRAYQDETLARLLTAGRKLGGKATVDFARELAADDSRSERLRGLALRVVEGPARSGAGPRRDGSPAPSSALAELLATDSPASSAEPAASAVSSVSIALASSAAPTASGTTSGPKGKVAVGGVGVAGGRVANANTVVARMRGRFQRCYQQLLMSRPDAAGSVVLVARIGLQGGVQSVGGGGGKLGPIVPCLKAVVSSGAFSAPEGGGAVVSIPLIFIKQER